jgi:Transposase IS66 family.
LTAPLPPEVIPGSHFGPNLIGFIVHQYHHQHVTQPLLWEQLDQFGIDISMGQLSRILTEQKEAFHQEKDQLLPAALEVSPYVQVDDTGARHKGRNGYCTQIGNDLFASFESTNSKSRLNFLELLRRPHTDYVINEIAVNYWEEQKLAAAVVEKLRQGPYQFGVATEWHARLLELGITAERHIRIASEGALLGSLIAHGVSSELGILSDGAGQFDVLVHIACWIHAERPLTRMVPYSAEHRAAIEAVRERIWELYQDLKGYRLEPAEAQRPILQARFDELCAKRTNFPSVDTV